MCFWVKSDPVSPAGVLEGIVFEDSPIVSKAKDSPDNQSDRMGASDKRVLSYGDVLLRESDVALLNGPHFLNDHVIEFFFNYLSQEYCSSSGLQEAEVSPLLLVGPTLTFWLLHCPDSEGLMATIEPMKFQQRDMVIFALNNNEDVETAEGGTHWTLLMFNRQRNTFEHYDSMAGTNSKQARELMNVIKPYMGGDVSKARLIDQATPQQENTYDCGVFVMAIAKVLCNAFQERKRVRNRSNEYAGLVRNSVSTRSVNTMRYTILELIHTLSAGGETRYGLFPSLAKTQMWNCPPAPCRLFPP